MALDINFVVTGVSGTLSSSRFVFFLINFKVSKKATMLICNKELTHWSQLIANLNQLSLFTGASSLFFAIILQLRR